MKFIFDWSDSLCEEKTSWRGDETMLSFEIFQQECSFASAHVKICTCSIEKILQKKYAKIGVQKNEGNTQIELIFSGRIIAFPSGIENSCIEIELIAEPDDYQQQLHDFSKENFEKYKAVDWHIPYTNLIPFDELFFSPVDFENPTIFLEGGSKIFYWDPKNGKLKLSDISAGEKNIDINGKNILQNSLKIHLEREPYRSVKISLSASWIQHIEGFIDVFPMIASRFQLGVVNSYTNMRHALEKICDTSQRKKGYSLIRCKINEFSPATEVGFLQQRPLVSKKFLVQSDAKIPPKEIQFKRFYMKGKMILGWNYRQKRTEIIHVNILNNKSLHGREKSICIKLDTLQLNHAYPTWRPYHEYKIGEQVRHEGKIFQCSMAHISNQHFDNNNWKLLQKISDALSDNSADSFFKTARGNNAIKYAIQKAIALINYSSRYVEISFSMLVNAWPDVTLDDQVTIHDARFPNGKISGKVIKIKFFADAEIRQVNITIACCPTGINNEFSQKLNEYCSEIKVQAEQCCPTPEDIVKGIEIQNPPEQQEKILQEISAKKIEELTSQLRKHNTKIKIFLHPINVMREIINKIHLNDFHL